MDVMEMDEDATFKKFRDAYWADCIEKGMSEEAIFASLDRNEFWDWLEMYVPEDDWVYL
jgi:hypothetical protein